LSAELQALLKRTQKIEVYKEASSEPSPALLSLLGRMEARRWKEETLTLTVEYIRESAYEIKLIQHLRTCKQCQMEAELSVERYGGRGLPWFLDLINDPYECCGEEDEDPRFTGRPHTEDYKIGSYWTGSSKDTMRFINDRINWAEKIIRQQIVMATQFYKRLKKWDLNGVAPTEPTLPF